MKTKKKKTFDILMGVGEKYYPDPAYFVEEVMRLGLSKRLPNIPEFFCCKKNKLWLVHWGAREIFGFVENIKIRIIAPENSAVCQEAKKKYGDECIICADYGEFEGDYAERGCGRLRTDGKYTQQI